ncbi:MAG: hypothetical protein HC812_06780 [Leptolyngbya sp. RL_3_1]|nr:hypothetical protein [Leptolyngbya sp. RL_3_1]
MAALKLRTCMDGRLPMMSTAEGGATVRCQWSPEALLSLALPEFCLTASPVGEG